MSIINQMLKDLERRRAAGFDNNTGMLDDLDAGAADEQPVTKGSNVWPVFFVFLLIAIISTWLYLSGIFQSDKKIVDPITRVESGSVTVVESEPVKLLKPEPEVYKSVVQEITVEEEKVLPIVTDDENTQLTNSGAVSPVVEVTSSQVDNEIKISNIAPSPLHATGEREVITVYGSGFVAPISVTVEWDDGRAFKELNGWQVKVISETELQLHLNLGKSEDNWRVLLKRPDGSQQAAYDFTVLAMKPQPIEAKQEPKDPVPKQEVVTSFTKTNIALTQDEQVRVTLSKANLLIQQGKIKQAKQSLRRVLALDFSNLEARQALAGVLFREKNYDEAIEVLELGSIQHPLHVPFTLLLARIYTERGQDPLAIDVLERSQPSVGPNSEYYALLAALYQRSAQYKNAADVYKKLLASFPSRAVWWMGLGLSLQSIEQKEDALVAYNKSLKLQGLSEELRRFVKTRILQLKS